MRNPIQNNHVIAYHLHQETEAWVEAEYCNVFGDSDDEFEAEQLALHHDAAMNYECALQRTNNPD